MKRRRLAAFIAVNSEAGWLVTRRLILVLLHSRSAGFDGSLVKPKCLSASALQ